MNYEYSDERLDNQAIYDMFINRVPYNTLGESIINFSNCGAIDFNSNDFNVITINSGELLDNIQRIINETNKPLKLQFQPGVYFFNKPLSINKSNIILEGLNTTGIIFRGIRGSNFNLIDIVGKRQLYNKTIYPILDAFIPIGGQKIIVSLDNANLLKIGNYIVITYEMNKNWVIKLGMDKITECIGADSSDTNWDSSNFVYNFERKIIAIDKTTGIITIDKEITSSLDVNYGNFYIRTFNDTRISNIKIKNIQIESEYDKTIYKMVFPIGSDVKELEYFDENHPMNGINVQWAKNVIIENLVSYGFNQIVYLDRSSCYCTVLNCSYYRPASVIEGEKRYCFNINGQYNLCMNCYAERGRHSFASASKNEGPLAFINCKARITYAWSEPHHRYNLCGLYDNLDDNIAVENRLFFGSGHGWIGAYYVLWNPKKQVICQNTPIATNFVIGGNNRDCGNLYITRYGYYFSSARFINFNNSLPLPFESLYQEQLLKSTISI